MNLINLLFKNGDLKSKYLKEKPFFLFIIHSSSIVEFIANILSANKIDSSAVII
jgi:hypothetical protein